MGKKSKAEKLDKIIADKSRPKAERKAAKLKRAALVEKLTVDDAALEQKLASKLDEALDEALGVDFVALEQALVEPEPVALDPEPAPPALEVDDASIARLVKAKRALRKAALLVEGLSGELTVNADDVPRDDVELVAAYNEVIGRKTGHYLTSDAERAEVDKRIGGAVAVVTDRDLDALDDAIAAFYADEGDGMGHSPETAAKVKAVAVTIAEHEAVEVETETGTVYAVGPTVETVTLEQTDPAAGFDSPSDAPILETNGLGQYKIKRESDGKLVGYTRVTTYIDNLEDKSQLAKWKLRILLEGLVSNELEVGTAHPELDETVPPHLLAEARDAIHVREVAIAKARKADRKGKLTPGELGDLVEAAMKACKTKLGNIAEQALTLGGVKAAAQKGTDLHLLTEVYDEGGIEPIAAMLDAGTITPADFADLEAYGAAMKRAGIRVIERESVVVNDELKVAGRLDKIVMAKPSPTAQRATRMVADVKTGSVSYAPGKIAQQLELYAGAKRYDLTTHERSDHGASRTTALLIHLPAGRAECFINVVNLATGRIGNRLSGDVRRWRSSSRKAIDFTVDLAAHRDEPEAKS